MGLTVYGGGGKPEEEKTVTAGTSVIEVNPSSGKVMKKVTVNPTPTESKSVTPTTSELTVTPSEGKHLSQVVVGAIEDVTPEVTAQTPVITQIAENLGVTITTPSGTNKQILQGNNANLLNIKNNAKKEGMYVWKKCLSGTITVTQANQNENPTILQLASNDIDLGLLTEKDFYDYSGTVSGDSSFEFFFSENGFGYRGAVTSQYTYDSVNHQLKLGELFGGHYTFPNYEAKIIRGYAVSDKSDAYPDGGTQDGYWYELFDSSIDFGEITITGNSLSITVEHNLGCVPSFVALITDVDPNYSHQTLLNLNGLTIVTGTYSNSYTAYQTNNDLTDTSITFKAYSNKNFAKTHYYWVAIA